MYEFNTRSGARRWKRSNEPLQPMLAMQAMSSATENSGQGVDRAEAPSKKEPPEKKKELTAAIKPAAKPQQGNQKHQAQLGWDCKRRKKSLRMWHYPHQPLTAGTDLLSQNELCFAIKPECMRLQGASQLTPDLNSQRIRCDFSLSLSCNTKGGHKVCKPKGRMNLDVPLAGACKRRREEEETKQSWTEAFSAHCLLQTLLFPPTKPAPMADMATSSACLWEWQHTQMCFLHSEWGLLSLLSNQMSEKHIRVEMFAGKS